MCCSIIFDGRAENSRHFTAQCYAVDLHSFVPYCQLKKEIVAPLLGRSHDHHLGNDYAFSCFLSLREHAPCLYMLMYGLGSLLRLS